MEFVTELDEQVIEKVLSFEVKEKDINMGRCMEVKGERRISEREKDRKKMRESVRF